MWQLLNSITKGNKTSQQISLEFTQPNGDIIDGKEDIAKSFNKFFIDVGEQLQHKIPSSSLDPFIYIVPQPNYSFDTLEETNSDELIQIVKTTKNTGAGIDRINASIFKGTYSSIIQALVHFINLCLSAGVFPEALKIAVVKPIYKSGDKKLFSNYRPISILPYLSKILEKIMYIRMTRYLHDAQILNRSQFGFQKNKSTYMPLLLLQDYITTSLEAGKNYLWYLFGSKESL